MNSKLLFVGKYARNASNSKKSPKTSPKKSPNRKSKSKYEDISLGLVVKKQNKLESNRNDVSLSPTIVIDLILFFISL